MIDVYIENVYVWECPNCGSNNTQPDDPIIRDEMYCDGCYGTFTDFELNG